MMCRGVLVAVEGIDGVGKTTQVQLLGRKLRHAGETPVLSKEPTDGHWGQRIRASANNGRMSLEDELEAFVEDRKEHVANVILPALNDGRIVILDRYFYSTIAYQGARGKSPSELAKYMKSFAPVPDVVLLIDVDPMVSTVRISQGRGDVPNEFERVEELAKVRDVFDWLAGTHDEIRKIDGHRSIDDVHRAMLDVLIDGVFKKFTAKDYDCDCWYCVHRETGSCRWFTLQGALRSNTGILSLEVSAG